jgi:hypothetical protein
VSYVLGFINNKVIPESWSVTGIIIIRNQKFPVTSQKYQCVAITIWVKWFAGAVSVCRNHHLSKMIGWGLDLLEFDIPQKIYFYFWSCVQTSSWFRMREIVCILPLHLLVSGSGIETTWKASLNWQTRCVLKDIFGYHVLYSSQTENWHLMSGNEWGIFHFSVHRPQHLPAQIQSIQMSQKRCCSFGA